MLTLKVTCQKPKNKSKGLDRVRALGFLQAAVSRHALAMAFESHLVAVSIPIATRDLVAVAFDPMSHFHPSDIDIGGSPISMFFYL